MTTSSPWRILEGFAPKLAEGGAKLGYIIGWLGEALGALATVAAGGTLGMILDEARGMIGAPTMRFLTVLRSQCLGRSWIATRFPILTFGGRGVKALAGTG